MATKITVLSAADKQLLEDLIRRERSQSRNPSGRARIDPEESPAPEVYVAQTPLGGIPSAFGATPGTALCDIYRALFVGDVPTLEAIGKQEFVLNFSSEVAAETFILIARDKFGAWYLTGIFAEVGTGTGPDEKVKVSINDTTAGYLLSKLVAGSNISLTEVNDGGNESLRISWEDESSTGTGTDSCNVIPGVDFDDLPVRNAPDYLLSITGGCLSKTEDLPGTGTGEGGGCTPVTMEETDLRCEKGNLNLYRRVVTLTLDTFGCLVKSSADWIYERTIACCDDTCAADGTGTGTGTGPTPDEIEKWWCMGRPDDTGIGTFGGDTGTGTAIDNAKCYFLSTIAKNALLIQGWILHGGPYSLEANCTLDCREDTGTGTGTLAGTGTQGGAANCSACPSGVPTTLQLTIVSGCPSGTTPVTLTYATSGVDGAGWYSPPGELTWSMICLGESIIVSTRCSLDSGAATSGGNIPISCNPFDSGNVAIATTNLCCTGPVVRITE